MPSATDSHPRTALHSVCKVARSAVSAAAHAMCPGLHVMRVSSVKEPSLSISNGWPPFVHRSSTRRTVLSVCTRSRIQALLSTHALLLGPSLTPMSSLPVRVHYWWWLCWMRSCTTCSKATALERWRAAISSQDSCKRARCSHKHSAKSAMPASTPVNASSAESSL